MLCDQQHSGSAEASDADANPDPSSAIRQRSLRLLGQREHSRLELRHKLSQRGFDADEIEAVLDQLTQEGLLREERLVESYVAERLAKGFGPLRVRAELQRKGIAETLIDQHLQLDDDQCFELLCEADRKRANRPDSATPNTSSSTANHHSLSSRARFLEYRGFPSHLIARLLSHDESFSL